MGLTAMRTLVVSAVVAGTIGVAAQAFASAVASLSVNPGSGSAGDTIAGYGTAFATQDAGPVLIRFNSRTGDVMQSIVPGALGDIQFTFAVPAVAPGQYTIVATQEGADGQPAPGTPARAAFQVDGPPPTTQAPAPTAATTTAPPITQAQPTTTQVAPPTTPVPATRTPPTTAVPGPVAVAETRPATAVAPTAVAPTAAAPAVATGADASAEVATAVAATANPSSGEDGTDRDGNETGGSATPWLPVVVLAGVAGIGGGVAVSRRRR